MLCELCRSDLGCLYVRELAFFSVDEFQRLFRKYPLYAERHSQCSRGSD